MSSTDDFIEEKLAEIDEQIEKINNSKAIRAAEALIQKRDRLKAARAALLGAGPKLTGGSGNGRMSQAEVVAFFERNVETGKTITVEELAKGLSTTQEVVRGHLNRGNGERFLTPRRGEWALRDPKNGVDTLEDLA